MKHISIIKKIALSLSTTLLCIQPAQAAVFEIQQVASTDSLNLRAQPGVRSPIVGQVPHNGKWIRTDGHRVAVGNTVWIKIDWRRQVGWVNEYFIRQMQLDKQKTTAHSTVKPKAAPLVKPVLNEATLNKKGAWVLECGHSSPFWRVIVHPGKALDVNLRGKSAGILPLTYQKQKKNKWNTAMKTIVKASNGNFATNMTIRYTKQCLHTLSNQQVRYRVKAQLNGEQLQGCCRAIQLP